MPRLLRLVLVLCVPALLAAGLLSATATSAGAHEERPAVVPRRHAASARRSSATTTPTTGGLPTGVARPDRQDARRRAQAAQRGLLRAVPLRLDPGRDQQHPEAQDLDLRAAGRLRGAQVRRQQAHPLLLAPRSASARRCRTRSTSAASPPRGAARPGRPGRPRRRPHDQPDRPVLRRPAQVPAQPQPDLAVRRPRPRATSRSAATAGSAAPRSSAPAEDDRRTRQQPVQEAQRDPAGPRRRLVVAQHDRSSRPSSTRSTCSRPTASCSTG